MVSDALNEVAREGRPRVKVVKVIPKADGLGLGRKAPHWVLADQDCLLSNALEPQLGVPPAVG